MDRDNRYIPRVIENGESRVRHNRGRRLDFSPRQALYYNDHPDTIIEDFNRSEYGAVLREIERHVIEWAESENDRVGVRDRFLDRGSARELT